MSEPFLLDAEYDDVVETVGQLAVKHQQIIPQSFIDDIRREREDSTSTLAGNFHRVARIPAAVINAWTREGFDWQRAPAREILAKLAKDQLDNFISTKKRI